MKKWERYLLLGVFQVIIGAILIMWAIQAVEPIKVEVYPDRVETDFDVFFLYPLLFGMFFLGMGLAETAVAYDFYKVEKES